MIRYITLFILIASLLPTKANCQCDFTLSNNTPCSLNTITFSVDNPNGNYTWDFDNDNVIDANGAIVSYQFPESFTTTLYPISLYKNDISCSTQNISVDPTPDPSIGVIPGSGILDDKLIRVCSGMEIITLEIFNASTTFANNNFYQIDWGNGSIENFDNTTFTNISSISHDYNGFGYYEINVTAIGSNGCENTYLYTLYNGGNPSVGLANPGNTVGLCAPATIDFPITNFQNNPTGTVYDIYVGGELQASFTQENVPAVFTYTFEETSCGLTTSTGNYTNAFDVQVEAINPCGSSQATIEPIEISEPPELSFEIDEPNILCLNETYEITNTSTENTEVTSGNPSTCGTLASSWQITPGVPGVHWNIISGNTFNSNVIEIEFLIPGDYTITMSINSPSCGDGSVSQAIVVSETLEVDANASLSATASPSIDECVSTLGTFTNLSQGDSLTYLWNISPSNGWEFIDSYDENSENLEVLFNEAGTYHVELTAENFCDAITWDTTLILMDVPEVLIDLPDYCDEAVLNLNAGYVSFIGNNGTTSSVEWSFPGGDPSSSTENFPTGINYLTSGEYVVSATVTNECGTATYTDTFLIVEPGSINIDNDITICKNANPFYVNASPNGGIWSGNGVDEDGLFTPSNQTIGDNVLSYSFQSGNCSVEASMVVTVLQLPNINAGPDQMACTNDAPLLIQGGNPSGGAWSVDNDGVIIGENVFDPQSSGEGVFTLTYSYLDDNGCNNSNTKTIIVNIPPVVEAGANQSICLNPNNVELTGYTPAGGIWTGTGVTASGIFNANNTNGIGTYTLFYTYNDSPTGCIGMDSLIMTVTENPIAEAGPDQISCIDGNPFTLSSGSPNGGIWSGNGIEIGTSIFDPMAAGVGTHLLIYTYGSGLCETTDTKIITVQDLLEIQVPAPQIVCTDVFDIDLTDVSPTGGFWEGEGVFGQFFDATSVDIGLHEITYYYVDPETGCENSATTTIEVIPLPTLSVSDTSYCNTSGWVDLPTPFPNGGYWSGDAISSGQFNPQEAGGAGSYTLTYHYTNSNGCENNKNITITVIDAQPINAGDDFNLCISSNDVNLNQIASPSGGTWNANGSTGLDGNIFSPSLAGIGTHTLTYTLGVGNCQVQDEIQITVTPLPIIDLGPNLEICESENTYVLLATPEGGTWQSNNGGILGGNIFNAQASGDGIYSFTYTFTDDNNCSQSKDLLITVFPLPEVNSNDTSFCNVAGLVELPFASPNGGTWSGAGVNGNSFDPVVAGGTGTHIVTYSFTDSLSCENSVNINITIIDPELIDAGDNDTLCIDQGSFALTNFIPSNGTWYGNGIIDSENGIFDPLLAGAGLHEITYSYGSGNCFVEDTKTVFVSDLGYVNAGPDETTCLTYEAFTLSGFSPQGGTWSGTGIIDSENGIFDPNVAGAGTYQLVYSFSDNISNCAMDVVKEIIVYDMLEADFTNPTIACRNEGVQFQNFSPNAYTMSWDFGDGTFSNDFAPTHSFDATGIFTITLAIENSYGCVDTIQNEIHITDVPVAFFVPDSSEECEGLDVHITNMSQGDELSYFWDFDNGQTSFEEHPDVSFEGYAYGDTSYIITLTTANLCGSSSYQDVVTVHPLPVADIGLSTNTDCSPLVIDFANTSIGAATSFNWDFGNGNTSTDIIPTTQWYFADTSVAYYTVSLIAMNQCGSDTTYTDLVVQPANVQSLFETSDTDGCQPFTVEFTNYSTTTATIGWNFGDGNTSSLEDPVHTFENPGMYTVIQYANSECGYDSSTVEILVLPAPEVYFEHASFVCLNQSIDFENLSENTFGNFWDFGDGDTSLVSSPSHIYTTPGEYTVTLLGLSSFNECPSTYTSTVTVLDLPVASFDPNATFGCVPFELQLENTSTSTTFYEWNFGNGNTSVEENPTHLFDEVGTYEVELIATDVNGCFSDTAIWNILVNPKPIASFDFDRASLCGLPAEISFENQSEGATGFSWTLGDETISSLNNPINHYTNAGYYDISLIASNQYGCVDTSYEEIRIYPEPIANFELQNKEGCEPVEVRFQNLSSQSNHYYWDFGNEQSSTDPNPTHTYFEAGNYDVELITSIDDVCFDTMLINSLVKVYDMPFANFEAIPISTNISDGVYELINHSVDAQNYYWEFSDGITSLEENLTHQFQTNGAHQIYLEASTDYGCVDDTLLTMTPEFFSGLYLPNGFSPEQGIGDVRLFKPKGTGLKEYHLQVFSSYGQLLWESKELKDGQPTEAWDGTYNGQLMPQDIYVWKCYGIFENGTSWSGVLDDKGNLKTMGSLILLR